MFEDFHTTPYETAEERERAASLPIAERQRLIAGILVPTPTFERTVTFLRDHHMPVEGGLHDRGRVCGILGPSRVGKSWAVKAYCASLGHVERTEAIMPRAVYLDCKKGWSALVFAQAMADAAQVPRRGRASAAAILELVSHDVGAHGVELVVVDDAQWLFANHAAADVVKGFVIGLAERRTCNVVLVGTEPISLVVRAESSLYGRGLFPTARLEPSGWLDNGVPGEFHQALGMIDAMLPFRDRSGLAKPWTAAHLYHLASGKLGLAMEVIRPAAQIALREDAACITVDHLKEAAARIRLPGDPWEAFTTSIDLDDPGTADSAWDADDREAEGDIGEVLAEATPKARKRKAPKEPKEPKLTKRKTG